jgi:hypothetical protein
MMPTEWYSLSITKVCFIAQIGTGSIFLATLLNLIGIMLAITPNLGSNGYKKPQRRNARVNQNTT